MSTGRYSQGSSYPSVSWADTLDIQRSALRWDVKRAMKSLCGKLAEIGEECFVVTVNISNGWVGHLGTPRGDEYIDDKSHILYDFLNYCAESFHAEENEEVIKDDGSDTDSCKGDDTNNEKEDDTPIIISRPCDENTGLDLPTVTPSDEERIRIEAPTGLLAERMIPVPVECSAEKFILLTPADIQTATQRVLETEYQPVIRTESPVVVQKQLGENEAIKKDKMVGSKRKRKQSFEGIEKLRPGIQSTDDAQGFREIKGKTNQRNKRSREEHDDSSLNSEYETSISKLPQRSKEVDLETVSETTRVLRDRNSRKHKRNETSDDEDDDDDVEEDGSEVSYSSDFDIDDAKDEDWDVNFEERGLYSIPGRDHLGRFKGETSRSSGRKQKEVKEGGNKEIGDESITVAKDGMNTVDSDKFVRVNFIHRIKADEKGIDIMEGRLEALEEAEDNEYSVEEEIEEIQVNSARSILKGGRITGRSSKRKKIKSTTAQNMLYKDGAKSHVNIQLENEGEKIIDKEQSTTSTEGDTSRKKVMRKSSVKRN